MWHFDSSIWHFVSSGCHWSLSGGGEVETKGVVMQASSRLLIASICTVAVCVLGMVQSRASKVMGSDSRRQGLRVCCYYCWQYLTPQYNMCLKCLHADQVKHVNIQAMCKLSKVIVIHVWSIVTFSPHILTDLLTSEKTYSHVMVLETKLKQHVMMRVYISYPSRSSGDLYHRVATYSV